jgi:hypothetical protein
MTDVTTDQVRDEVELSAADEQLVRELTERAEADRRGRPAREAGCPGLRCSAGVDVRASPMPGCPAVAPGGRGSAALVFPFLVIVAVGTGKTDGRACRLVTAAAISPAQGHRSASRSRRSAMTFPGRGPPAAPATGPARLTGRGPGRSPASPRTARRPRPVRPGPAVRRHHDAVGACTIPHPKKCLRLEPDGALDKPYPHRSKGTFSFIPVAAAYSGRSPGLVKARALPHPAVLAMAGWGRLSCGCAVRVRSARTPGPGRHGHETSWMTF